MKATAKAIAGKIEKAAGRAASKEHHDQTPGPASFGKAQKKYGDARGSLKGRGKRVLSRCSNSSLSQTRFCGFSVLLTPF